MLYLDGKAMKKGKAKEYLNVQVVDQLGMERHCDWKKTGSRRPVMVIC